MLYNNNVWYQTIWTTAMTKKISSLRSQEARSSAPGPQPASIANRFCPGMKPSGTSSWPPGKRQHANLKKKHSKGQGRTTAARILQIQMTSTSLITGFWMIPDDSWWFLQLHPAAAHSPRPGASQTLLCKPRPALAFPREWGPERKPGCGWLPVNSMCQSQILPFVCWSSGLKVKVSYNSELPMASPWCHLVIGCHRKTYAKLEVLLAMICKAMFWSAHIGAVRSLVLFAWLVNVLPDSRSVCYLARLGRKHAKTIRERVRTNLSHRWAEQKSLGWILWLNVASS